MLVASESLLADLVEDFALSLSGLMLYALPMSEVGLVMIYGEAFASLAMPEALLT